MFTWSIDRAALSIMLVVVGGDDHLLLSWQWSVKHVQAAMKKKYCPTQSLVRCNNDHVISSETGFPGGGRREGSSLRSLIAETVYQVIHACHQDSRFSAPKNTQNIFFFFVRWSRCLPLSHVAWTSCSLWPSSDCTARLLLKIFWILPREGRN